MKKAFIFKLSFSISVICLPLFTTAQNGLSNSRALEIISALEVNPIQTNGKKMADSLAQWLDECKQVVVYITKEEMENVMDSKFAFSREMYILLLGGMARYDLQHPDDNPEIKTVDQDAGMQCMCNGFHALTRSQGKMKEASYFKKICKKYPAQLTAKQVAKP